MPSSSSISKASVERSHSPLGKDSGPVRQAGGESLHHHDRFGGCAEICPVMEPLEKDTWAQLSAEFCGCCGAVILGSSANRSEWNLRSQPPPLVDGDPHDPVIAELAGPAWFTAGRFCEGSSA